MINISPCLAPVKRRRIFGFYDSYLRFSNSGQAREFILSLVIIGAILVRA